MTLAEAVVSGRRYRGRRGGLGAMKIILHRDTYRSQTLPNEWHSAWTECCGTPVGDTRCRKSEHITVIPEQDSGCPNCRPSEKP